MVDEPVPIISPQKLLSKHLRYQHIKLFGVFPENKKKGEAAFLFKKVR